MNMKEDRNPLKILWQLISLAFVLYGFYLLFLFFWDTFIRINENLALPLAVFLTALSMLISTLLWGRKYIEALKIIFGR